MELEGQQVTAARASFFERLGALILDWVIVAIVAIIVGAITDLSVAYTAWIVIGRRLRALLRRQHRIGEFGQLPV